VSKTRDNINSELIGCLAQRAIVEEKISQLRAAIQAIDALEAERAAQTQAAEVPNAPVE
jgi:hypothetical protein